MAARDAKSSGLPAMSVSINLDLKSGPQAPPMRETRGSGALMPLFEMVSAYLALTGLKSQTDPEWGTALGQLERLMRMGQPLKIALVVEPVEKHLTDMTITTVSLKDEYMDMLAEVTKDVYS